MTPEQVEKAAKENCPRDLNFRKECDDNRCGAIVSWKEGYVSGANLLMARVDRLEEALKKIKEDAAIVHDDALYTLCDAALEGKES